MYLCVRVFGVCACHVHVCVEEVCVEEGVWRRVCVKGVREGCVYVCVYVVLQCDENSVPHQGYMVGHQIMLGCQWCVLKLWQGRFVRCVDSKQ